MGGWGGDCVLKRAGYGQAVTRSCWGARGGSVYDLCVCVFMCVFMMVFMMVFMCVFMGVHDGVYDAFMSRVWLSVLVDVSLSVIVLLLVLSYGVDGIVVLWRWWCCLMALSYGVVLWCFSSTHLISFNACNLSDLIFSISLGFITVDIILVVNNLDGIIVIITISIWYYTVWIFGNFCAPLCSQKRGVLGPRQNIASETGSCFWRGYIYISYFPLSQDHYHRAAGSEK